MVQVESLTVHVFNIRGDGTSEIPHHEEEKRKSGGGYCGGDGDLDFSGLDGHDLQVV